MAAQQALMTQCELFPDAWIRGGYQAHIYPVVRRLARYMAANYTDLVLVENASSGMMAVVRSLNLTRGDVVLQLSTAYAQAVHMMTYLDRREGTRTVYLSVRFPGKGAAPTASDGSNLLEALTRLATEHAGSLKLAIFDHISSSPGVVWDVAAMSSVIKSVAPAAHVLVDGAHALGQVPIDLAALQAAGVDSYITNAHKWLYAPKGSAVLWVKPSWQQVIIPTVISASWEGGVVQQPTRFLNRFQYTGTRDYTPFAATAAALSFRETVGEERIMTYCSELAQWAQTYLAQRWGTEYLLPAENTAFMIHPRVPTNDPIIATALVAALTSQYNINVVLLPLTDPQTDERTYWFRLSSQIYLERADFVALGDAVLRVLADLQATPAALLAPPTSELPPL